MGGRSVGGAGCFELSSASVSSFNRAGISLEHNILDAALIFPSSSLAATAAATDLSLFGTLPVPVLFGGVCVSPAKSSAALAGHEPGNSTTRFFTVEVRLCWRPPLTGCSSIIDPKVRRLCQLL